MLIQFQVALHTLQNIKDHVELVFSPTSRAMSVVAEALLRAKLRHRIRYRRRGYIQTQPAAWEEDGTGYRIIQSNSPTQNIPTLKNSETTITNRNWIQVLIRRKLNSRNNSYYSVRKLLSSHLRVFYKTLLVRIYYNSEDPVVWVWNAVSYFEGLTCIKMGLNMKSQGKYEYMGLERAKEVR